MSTAPRPIRSLLVANRGEIARRIMRTATSMGIATVAVYSDADADAPHVYDADTSVNLPGNSPAETYLRADLIIAAAVAAGADAVHPGYGFLAENSGFASAVIDAGLTWVGPPPSAIEAMGSKLAAKAAMHAAGVPTLPWATDPADADGVGFPLLVKASAGGGGRGMRVVRDPALLVEAVAAAQREAGSAFGDATIFLEKYVDNPRHVEIQIFADTHGNAVSLFERECSIQRRHQKIVEESPSPAVDDDLRARMGSAAVAAAVAVGYLGAGTVEFVLDAAGDFSFLEMNTRLQVEHPVTEAVTGLDLVRLQLLVAAGEPLPPEALAPTITGHAIEVRIVAEDVDADFLPQSGELRDWSVPGVVAAGVRRRDVVSVDSGVDTGSVVSPFYDSMLAKVISHAPTRSEAAAALACALDRSKIFGVTTNTRLLGAILREPEFLAGGTDTGYLTRHGPSALGGVAAVDQAAITLSAVAAVLALHARNRSTAMKWARLPGGWRNNPSQLQQVTLAPDVGDGSPVSVAYALVRGEWSIEVDGETVDVTVHAISPAAVDVSIDGVRRRCGIAIGVVGTGGVSVGGETIDVSLPTGSMSWRVEPRFVDPGSTLALGSLIAPMPGSVIRVLVEAGAIVESGTPLVVLEAMKMEHTVSAPAAGVVATVAVGPGQQVDAGALLVVIDDPELAG